MPEDKYLFSIGVHGQIESDARACHRQLWFKPQPSSHSQVEHNCRASVAFDGEMARRPSAEPSRRSKRGRSQSSIPASSCPGCDVRTLRAIVRCSENDPRALMGAKVCL